MQIYQIRFMQVPTFTSLIQILDFFKEDSVCREYLAHQRWNGKPTCPKCGHSEKIYNIENGARYKCAKCLKKFSVTVGTVFEKSQVDLRTWFAAIYLCSAHKKGISSCQLARDLNISQKTAWFVLHRIREMLRTKAPQTLVTGTTECDETYVGGKNANRHANKKVKDSQGRSAKDKTPVFGVLERGGDVVLNVVPDTKAETLQPIIKSLVQEGAILVTDEWSGYSGIQKEFVHETVNHSLKEYVRENYHTNTIEGFWSLFKRGVFGIYHHVSRKHLSKYCDEFAYRYNTRKAKDGSRFDSSMLQTAGRLTYKKLTAKTKGKEQTEDLLLTV